MREREGERETEEAKGFKMKEIWQEADSKN